MPCSRLWQAPDVCRHSNVLITFSRDRVFATHFDVRYTCRCGLEYVLVQPRSMAKGVRWWRSGLVKVKVKVNGVQQLATSLTATGTHVQYGTTQCYLPPVGLATPKVAGSTPGLALSGNNLLQVVHTHVPLSPSSIIWYRSRGGDALRLGR